MRLVYSVPVLFSYPLTAAAAEQQGEAGGFSLLSGSIQMLASLAVVVGIILVLHYLSKRWMKSNLVRKSIPKYIRIVENRFLAPKKSLLLIEVAGEYLLLSNCGDNLNLIKQIDMLEEIEVVGDMSTVPLCEAVQDKLKKLAARIPAGGGGLAAVLKKGGVRS